MEITVITHKSTSIKGPITLFLYSLSDDYKGILEGFSTFMINQMHLRVKALYQIPLSNFTQISYSFFEGLQWNILLIFPLLKILPQCLLSVSAQAAISYECISQWGGGI